MTNASEKLVATAKAGLTATQELATKAQAATQKLVDLNMSTAKATLSDSLDHAKAVMAAKDPQALAALQAGLAQPAAAKATAYAEEFQKIVAGANAEFTKAGQANMDDVQKGYAALMASATNPAPAGT